jgi:hypothetical protein
MAGILSRRPNGKGRQKDEGAKRHGSAAETPKNEMGENTMRIRRKYEDYSHATG